MSVLIKGIKMPKCCADCPCFYDFISCQALSDGTDDFSASGFDEYKEHLSNCPLVEVPTPHGRLIDADELKEWIKAWFVMHRSYHPYSKSNLVPTTEVVDIIDRLAAIIEAEEGGEE